MLANSRQTYRADALVAAGLTTLDVRLHALAKLLEQEGALQPHLHDRAVEAHAPDARFFVRGFDFVQTALELDTFAVVGLFDAGCERCAGGTFGGDCKAGGLVEVWGGGWD